MMNLFTALLVCMNGAKAQDNKISDPRKELDSAITSGERAFLNYMRKLNNGTDTVESTRTSSVLTPDVPRELLQLSNKNFDTTQRVDENEFMRTQLKAQGGSNDASYFMGLFYLYGLESLEPNEEIAAEYFRMSADRGHGEARVALGILLYYGHGNIKEDKALATDYFRLASDEGTSLAHFFYARSLFESAALAAEDYVDEHVEEAARLFELVVDDIAEASHLLGVMYEYEVVKSKTGIDNFARAVQLYESASQRGYIESTYHLALMYSSGRGVPQDYVKAAEFFRVVASHPYSPHPPSMRYLAIILANGYSDPFEMPDYDEALYWYDRCASQTHSLDFQLICRGERQVLLDFVQEAKGALLAEKK